MSGRGIQTVSHYLGQGLAAETSGAVTKMLDCGVEHHDVRPPIHVLWNPEIRNVVLVDFERLEILKQVEVLQETSPNRKRKQLHHRHHLYHSEFHRPFDINLYLS